MSRRDERCDLTKSKQKQILGFKVFAMAEANKKEDCQCTSKWDFLQFGLEKGEDGKSNFVRLKGQPNAHLLLANQVLIQDF